MHRLLAQSLSRTLGLCAILALSAPVLADQWDTLGGKPRYGRHGGNSTRYSVNKHDLSRHYAAPRSQHRGRDVDVNIIVGGIPRGRVRQPYPYSGFGSRTFYNGQVFNPSLGFLGGGIVTYVNATPLLDYRDNRPYVRKEVIIERDRRGTHISLLKDRYGNCWERGSDPYGQSYQRELPRWECDF